MDFLRRTLQWNGYELLHAMNITDVGHLVSDGDDGEDKMNKTARGRFTLCICSVVNKFIKGVMGVAPNIHSVPPRYLGVR